MPQPPVSLPEAVRADLEACRPGLAADFELSLASHVRPCVKVKARRVSSAPLRRNPLARLLGLHPALPALGALESKFGGTPYSEADDDWRGFRFLGQLELAQATAVLPPDHYKLSGLLRIDCADRGVLSEGLRVRWFPKPSLGRAVATNPPSFGRWESRLEFSLGWTLPEGRALDALWPLRERHWSDYDEPYPAGYNADGFDEFHRMLGHKSAGLDEPHPFSPPAGGSADLASYECLLRLTYDNAAGFAWGSNRIYLLVPREDLGRGDLNRVIAVDANS